MPELPELEVVSEVLRRRVLGQTIADVQVAPAGSLVVRDLTHAGFAPTLTGSQIVQVERSGKFLVFTRRVPTRAQTQPALRASRPRRFTWSSTPN